MRKENAELIAERDALKKINCQRSDEMTKCIHFNHNVTKDNCKALDVRRCIGERCSFYATTAQKNKLLENAYKRLCELPVEKQMEYAVRYYDGKMPWRAER